MKVIEDYIWREKLSPRSPKEQHTNKHRIYISGTWTVTLKLVNVEGRKKRDRRTFAKTHSKAMHQFINGQLFLFLFLLPSLQTTTEEKMEHKTRKYKTDRQAPHLGQVDSEPDTQKSLFPNFQNLYFLPSFIHLLRLLPPFHLHPQ